MSRGSVHDFMTEYGGKLRFTLDLDQQSPGDRDLAARQAQAFGVPVLRTTKS